MSPSIYKGPGTVPESDRETVTHSDYSDRTESRIALDYGLDDRGSR